MRFPLSSTPIQQLPPVYLKSAWQSFIKWVFRSWLSRGKLFYIHALPHFYLLFPSWFINIHPLSSSPQPNPSFSSDSFLEIVSFLTQVGEPCIPSPHPSHRPIKGGGKNAQYRVPDYVLHRHHLPLTFSLSMAASSRSSPGPRRLWSRTYINPRASKIVVKPAHTRSFVGNHDSWISSRVEK